MSGFLHGAEMGAFDVYQTPERVFYRTTLKNGLMEIMSQPFVIPLLRDAVHEYALDEESLLSRAVTDMSSDSVFLLFHEKLQTEYAVTGIDSRCYMDISSMIHVAWGVDDPVPCLPDEENLMPRMWDKPVIRLGHEIIGTTSFRGGMVCSGICMTYMDITGHVFNAMESVVGHTDGASNHLDSVLIVRSPFVKHAWSGRFLMNDVVDILPERYQSIWKGGDWRESV